MMDTITAGDALDFDTGVPDYPASNGWTLTYRLVPRTSGTAYSFDAVPADDGERYAVEVSSSTTALWASGAYTWAAYVTKTGERHVVDSGPLTILPDPVTATALDGRSDARKKLDAIDAMLMDRASDDQKRVVIRDREVERFSRLELIKERQYWAAIVRQEEDSDRMAAGLSPRNRIYVRL